MGQRARKGGLSEAFSFSHVVIYQALKKDVILTIGSPALTLNNPQILTGQLKTA